MDQEHLVQDISVQMGQEIYKATYFVEGGTIHANIAGQTWRLPLGQVPAEQAVRSLLIEKLRRHNFRQAMAHKWFGDK